MSDKNNQLPRRPWDVAIDVRDIIAGLGGVMVIVGAAAFHWAAALVVIGLGLCGLAWRLTK